MKTKSTLVESLLPVRSCMAREELPGTYDVASQTRGVSIDGRFYPDEVRSSDGGNGGNKITDKSLSEICWVAREVYGVHDPRWQMFREWLLTDAPVWFRNLYTSHGEAFAEWVSDKPTLKILIRRWMDSRIKAGPVRVIA